MPERIQRKRTRGWRMPVGAVYVGRRSRWGNPYKLGDSYKSPISECGMFHVSSDNVLMLFETYAKGRLAMEPDWLDPLRGHDLACWCRVGAVCHADVLLKLAGRPTETQA